MSGSGKMRLVRPDASTSSNVWNSNQTKPNFSPNSILDPIP